MASQAHRFNGDTPLTGVHGGTAKAAQRAVKLAKMDRAKAAAQVVLEQAAGIERKDRVRKRVAMRLIENDKVPPYLPTIEPGLRFARSGITPMHVYIWDRCGGRCHYCGKPMMRMPNERASFTLDHVVPRSRGGAHHSSNIVGACAGCNQDKGSLTGEEYEAVREVRRRAQGIEAGTATTAGRGPKDESPVA